MFNVSEVNELHMGKHEMLVQLEKFRIAISCHGILEVNRSFAATVSDIHFILTSHLFLFFFSIFLR